MSNKSEDSESMDVVTEAKAGNEDDGVQVQPISIKQNKQPEEGQVVDVKQQESIPGKHLPKDLIKELEKKVEEATLRVEKRGRDFR